MKRLIGIAFALGLAACAQTPVSSDSTEVSGDGAQRAKIHTELAAQYYSRGQHAIALNELRVAIHSYPSYGPAYNMLGLVHTELREHPQAEESFRRAISLSRLDSEAHNNFGYFLCQQGRHDEGIAQLDQALSNPLYVSPERALANAGVCALDKGDFTRAEGYLQRALARMPTHSVALNALGELHFRRGNYPAARATLLQLSQAGDLDAAALWLGVRVERKLGDRMAEGSYGAQLRRRFPGSAQTQLLLNGQYDGRSK